MKHVISIFLLFQSILAFPQSAQQTVSGNIIDAQSETPLIGATIQLVIDGEINAAISDLDGNFKLEKIAVGRQAFIVQYLGYETVNIPNVEVTSGKQVFLSIEMEESLIQLEELVIKAEADKDKSINEMATISSRQFSMEEVNRFSGGRSDVARLAGNFAGVSTADDSRNDIVIRGNSPTGLLWRLEGIPIPSPNHFSTVGTTGGPVSALNTNLLKNSDFLTSAFPSEYGNALSGVFDLGFRSGNKDDIEYTFQVGAITGVEAMIEGPISKDNNSSFLVAGRYSFLGIAQAIGMEIGTNAVPNYQDLSFKLDLGKSPLGNFTIFGIGGVSDIEFLREEVDEKDLFSADDEDARANSHFGVLGLRHNILLNNHSYIRTVIGLSANGVEFSRDRYYNENEPSEFRSPFVKSDDQQRRISLSSYYNNKVSSQLTVRGGFLIERVHGSLAFDSAEFGDDINNDGIFDLVEIYNFEDHTTLIQPFLQGQYKLNANWTINAGAHGLYYDLNKQSVLEPRAGINYQMTPKHKVSLGYGLHHQTQPIPIQIASKVVDNQVTNPNLGLEFSKSHQYVFAHDYKINHSWRSKIELYHQSISNVPVDKDSSPFSILNVGADFGFPIDKNDLINEGTGTNRGIEFTLEKFFNDGYYLLATGSILSLIHI